MRLSNWLQSGQLQRHSTSGQEIADLRALVERSLSDAPVRAISCDLWFSAACNAALALATMVLYCAGYRTRGVGHHATTFAALPLIMGSDLEELADYLEVCRTKRNLAEYRRSGAITASGVDELVASVIALREQVEQWLRSNRPEFALPDPEQESGNA